MKPIDVIEQLVGDVGGCDIIDTSCFQFHQSSKHEERTVSINLETGILEVYNKAGDAIEKTYAIRATLEPITNDV